MPRGIDDEGFVYIVDRWKDMYISGGENVYPAEVENVLFQLPQVADAAIIGVPNERWGEVGMAIIVRKPDQALEEGDVIRHCLGRLAKFKVPQSVTFVDVAAAQRHRQGAEARAADPVRRHRPRPRSASGAVHASATPTSTADRGRLRCPNSIKGSIAAGPDESRAHPAWYGLPGQST